MEQVQPLAAQQALMVLTQYFLLLHQLAVAVAAQLQALKVQRVVLVVVVHNQA